MTRAFAWALILICLFSLPSLSIILSGRNVPYDSMFHMGLVSGLGTGVDIGADVFFPVEFCSIGADVEQQVTNTNFEQNINMLKLGLAVKFDISEDIFLTLHYGGSQFYVGKELTLKDSLNGQEILISADTHGHATYWGFSPCFRIGEYFVMPSIYFNTIPDGGTLLEGDLNVGHRF